MRLGFSLCFLLCFLLLIVGFNPNANAKIFRNAYVSFELPPNWDCKLIGTDWTCVSKFQTKSKEAMIALTAKQAGPADTLPAYMAYLKQPHPIKSKTGKEMVQSKVLHVRQRQVSGHAWVDALHLGSEMTDYYTRYLTTIKGRISVLITFSAHKLHYTKYSSDFLNAIQSLRIVAGNDVGETKVTMPSGPSFGTGTIGQPTSTMDFDGLLPPEETPSSGPDPMELGLGLALIIGAIGFYIYRKKKGK